MISTEAYAKIRQCRKNGFSRRKTAELLGMSRNTIKRYWDGAHIPDEKKNYPAKIDSPQKELVMTALTKYFQENKTIGKQRVNAKTAWEAIRETYAVGESTVRRYVRELKGINPEGFIPLSFEPGEMTAGRLVRSEGRTARKHLESAVILRCIALQLRYLCHGHAKHENALLL